MDIVGLEKQEAVCLFQVGEPGTKSTTVGKSTYVLSLKKGGGYLENLDCCFFSQNKLS